MSFWEAKSCSLCKEAKPLSEFHQAPRYSQGVYSRCKSCYAKVRSRNYRGNEESLRKKRERDRLRYEANPEPVRQAARAYYAKTGWQPQVIPPDHAAAYVAVKTALRAGTLVKPKACTDCGKIARIEGHHEDYSKPLDIAWLCRACHRRRHRKP